MAVSTSKPRLALLMGDPSGIGPEVAVKLLSRNGNAALADIVLLTDPRILTAGEQAAQTFVEVNSMPALEAAAIRSGQINFFALRLLGGNTMPALGRPNEVAGRAVLMSLRVAAEVARSGLVDGIVFAPLNAQAMRLAGLAEEDEMRFLQRQLGADVFLAEININDRLWTSRVTSRIPLRDVAAALTTDGICSAVRNLDGNLRAAGVGRPRVAVAGLNPHGGDGSHYGEEEVRIIEPAIRRMQAEGVDVHGPFPAETVFLDARDGGYDAVVSMYHDQGRITTKLMGFDRGATLFGGLPVPVTTCAGGTAFDIAGKGVAMVEGMQQAFSIAARIALGRGRTH